MGVGVGVATGMTVTGAEVASPPLPQAAKHNRATVAIRRAAKIVLILLDLLPGLYRLNAAFQQIRRFHCGASPSAITPLYASDQGVRNPTAVGLRQRRREIHGAVFNHRADTNIVGTRLCQRRLDRR